MTKEEQEAFTDALENCRKFQREFIDSLYDQTLKLLQRKQDIPTYLSLLLKTRISYLEDSEKLITTTLKTPTLTQTLPTIPKNLEELGAGKQ